MRSSGRCIIVVIWAYSQVAQAYSTFEPECTNPEEAVNFVGSPPTRGTLDILWSSLFTIFACTYTILHLNVPEQRDSEDAGRWENLQWGMKSLWGKAKWMLITVLAPEATLVYASIRLIYAHKRHPEFKALADVDQVPWTLAHTTLAIMGGFVLRGRSNRVGKDPEREISTAKSEPPATEQWYILDLDTILKLRSEGHITLPRITTSEIDDHSKGDSFAKAIAVVQIVWTIASTITRAIRGLAISQLEISVIAFSVCALTIYACYWTSPKDVSVPITFLQWRGHIPSPIMGIVNGAKLGQARITNDTFFNFSYDNVTEFTALSFGALAFGAPHLLAWSSTFPTPAERIVWRAAALYCSVFGLVFNFVLLAYEHLGYSLERYSRWSAASFITLGIPAVYILLRLFLLVETFRTLLFLPPSAYIATWTANVPMFG
ncbi:hypothetical protein V494_02047 [Pseudogymnoascus sp. VKM F-4513 (FW-928)]|nr:hypothetical protein V494_02047 [Pseudogymnoascus sp. VKM F-4513 (FW-928)]